MNNIKWSVLIALLAFISGVQATTIFSDNFDGASGTLQGRKTPVGGLSWSDNFSRSVLTNNHVEVSAANQNAKVVTNGLNRVIVLEADFLMNGANLTSTLGGAILGMSDGAGAFSNPTNDAITLRLIANGTAVGKLTLFSKENNVQIASVTSAGALSGYDTDKIHLTLTYDMINLKAVGIASNTANGVYVTVTNSFSQAQVDALTINSFGFNTTGWVSGTAVWDNVTMSQILEPSSTQELFVISGAALPSPRKITNQPTQL